MLFKKKDKLFSLKLDICVPFQVAQSYFQSASDKPLMLFRGILRSKNNRNSFYRIHMYAVIPVLHHIKSRSV